MALTRSYKDSVQERVARDPDFAGSLLREAIECLLDGEPETARIILRDLVNSTMGFEALAVVLSKPSKSVHRMLSPRGNPTMDNLTSILVALQNSLDAEIEVNLSTSR